MPPDYYVKYSLTLTKGGKDFSTTFVSDPRAFGEPTVTQVFSALADDALTLQKYSTDEFVDKLYAQGVKPSAALRAYDSCKETNLWMQDELYLSGWEIEEISKTLTKHGDEVNTLVEKAASERAARYAYDHPKLPKGFVTIEQLQGDLDLGDLRDEMKDFDYEEEMRALAAFFNGEKSDMSDFVNPYGGNHILVSGSVGRWNGTSTGIAVSIDTMLKNGNQFSLDGGIPAWTVEGDDLAKVNDFLKKSCMEFSGSLPGDEKDEDSYSLTGEAKDATASRNGLSRNQMGIEEKAAECKEAATVLANGNAL